MCRKIAEELVDFIYKSPSCFHVVDNIKAELEKASFTELFENEKWVLEGGKGYFVTRNMSSIVAFRVPKDGFTGFMIAAAHGDSPTFKIKEKAENAAGKYVQLNIEKYGGMAYSPWFDRPLSVAGRILVQTNGKIETRLVNIDRDLMIIPSVAIHMNKSINDGFKCNPAVDLQPLLGTEKASGSFMKAIAGAAGVNAGDILASDLFLYLRQKGSVWGEKEEFISAPKLDDLQCVFALMKGFVQSCTADCVPVMCIFDNEEVGSGTKQGAKASLLRDTLERISDFFGNTRDDYKIAISQSFMVSADNAHAVHPNHPELADKSDSPYINAGIAIKHNANQKYTTDGISEALFRTVCKTAGVPVQTYDNRADLPGGSTLGNLSLEQVAVNSIDIGLAQLSMHSAFETAGTEDTEYLVSAMKEYFSSSLKAEKDGIYII